MRLGGDSSTRLRLAQNDGVSLFSHLHVFFKFYSIAACAADKRAIGTRNGEQLT